MKKLPGADLFADSKFDFVAPAPVINADFHDSPGNDVIKGTTGNDHVSVTDGGSDTVLTHAGDDRINMHGTLSTGDRINGGIGNDTVVLNGDYSAGLTLGAETLVNVETLLLTAGHSYAFTLGADDPGEYILEVNGFNLSASDSLYFDGSANTSSYLTLVGSPGNDVLIGGEHQASFNLTAGGNDTVRMGNSDDNQVNFGAAFTVKDHVTGGLGRDTMVLSGDYPQQQVFHANTMKGIDTLYLYNGNYNFVLQDANIDAHTPQFWIVAATLLPNQSVIIDDSAETSSFVTFYGSTGDDVFAGGAAGFLWIGREGADRVVAGAGHDAFYFNAPEESTSTHFDTVVGADFAGQDTINTSAVPTQIDTVSGGHLSASTFDHDLKQAITHHVLGYGDAVLFEPDSGSLKGEVFVIVDANGHAGYQPNQDFVIRLENTHHLGALDVSDFTTPF